MITSWALSRTCKQAQQGLAVGCTDKHLNPSTDAQRVTLLQQTPRTNLMCVRISTCSQCQH